MMLQYVFWQLDPSCVSLFGVTSICHAKCQIDKYQILVPHLTISRLRGQFGRECQFDVLRDNLNMDQWPLMLRFCCSFKSIEFSDQKY